MDTRLFHNAHFLGADGRPLRATAMAVAGGRITALGDHADLARRFGPGDDLGGSTVVPAFTDSHIHLMEAGLAVGERPWRAHHQAELARALGSSDPGRADRLRGQASQAAADLNLAPLAGWLVTRAAPRPAAAPGNLTPRETEILRGLVGGLSDKEIAFRLDLSPFTVGNHLRSIYGKLGRNSRLEAARWATQAGLEAWSD